MRELGRIVRLQIQRSSLKTGEKPRRAYDPAPLLAVDRVALGPDGVLGEDAGGAWLVDVHHRAHPWTKNEDGVRSEEHTSELQSQSNLVCRLLLEKKKKTEKTQRE